MSDTSTLIELHAGDPVPPKQEGLTSVTPSSLIIEGGFAVLDQAVFSGSHFVMSFLLARWLPPGEYGLFALAYAIFALFLAIHSALLGEPLTVYGAGRCRERFEGYLRGVLRAHWLLTLPGGVTLAITGYLLDSSHRDFRWALWGVGLSLPGVLLLWLVRRASYARLQPSRAVLMSTAYSALLIGLLVFLLHFELLSTFTALAAMTASALTVCYVNLSSSWGKAERSAPVPFADVIRDHWNYGSWAVVASGATWLTLNIYFLVLPATHGLGAAANLRALTNLMTPCLQAFVGIAMMLAPFFARRKQTYGLARMVKDLQKVLVLLLAGSLLYAGLIWILRDALFSFLYAGRYGKDAGLAFLLLLLLPFVGSFALVVGAGLRAMERPDLVFAAYAGGVGIACLFGVPLAQSRGIVGAGAGLLLSEAVAGGLCVIFLFRLRRKG